MSTSHHTDGEPLPKRPKLDGPLIGTHSGTFHADEALAVYLLRLLPTYHASPLVRSRDPSVLATCHTIVDVGGEYSDDTKRYDHHQRGFVTTFPGRNTKLSSAGLVYMHYGKAVIARVTGLNEGSEEVEILFQKLYDCFVEAVDANDNGVKRYDGGLLEKYGIEAGFDDRGFSLASVVARYNYAQPKAQEEDSEEVRQGKEDERFVTASNFMGEQFVMELQDKFEAWLPARTAVRKAYAERKKWDDSGRIMVFENSHMPFADHLYEAEREEAKEKSVGEEDTWVLYVLFPETKNADSKWRVRAVGVEGKDFTNRKDLPDAWKGVRDDELSKLSGIPGCIFVHASGFIGGNKTFDGALRMAQKAVAM
jgi:uncharacterized UPF0160 family protein